jgi:hypothetical protein
MHNREDTMSAVYRDGDIFRWRWTDAEYARRAKECGSTVYWCMSNIAICKDGELVDTYWHSIGSNYRLDLDRVVVTFLGNPADMKRIPDYERVFYKFDDVVNLAHANNSHAPVYAKGPRDPETMQLYFQNEIEKRESNIRMDKQRIEEFKNALAKIEAGQIEEVTP